MVRNRVRYVIIGAGGAGMAAAATIRQHDVAAKITVLSAETDHPYYRPLIPFLISGEKKTAEMFIDGYGPFVTHGIDILLQTKVTTIDTHHRVVVLYSGEEIAYDKLLIASGSHSFVPPIPGSENKGVFTLRNIQDVRAVSAWAAGARNVVLIGGGLLGLETGLEPVSRTLHN